MEQQQIDYAFFIFFIVFLTGCALMALLLWAVKLDMKRQKKVNNQVKKWMDE